MNKTTETKNKPLKKEWWPAPGFEPQGQYLDGMSDESIQTTFVQIARSGVGLGPAYMPYLNLCYPGDTRQHQKIMVASQHGCALACGGWMRAGGCRHPLLKPPYWARYDAFTRLEEIARDYPGCWGGHDGEFSEGDILLVGTDVPRDAPHRAKIIAQWGTPGHAMLVEKIDGANLTTIDAGRGTIVRTLRTFHKDTQDRVWVTGFTTRRIWGSIRVARLKFDPDTEWCLPKGPGYPGLIG